MIRGIGIDLVEVERISTAIEKNKRFINRVLTEEEVTIYQNIRATYRRAEFVAGRFAAKEAFTKAMGTGIGSACSFQDISILRSEQGAPTMRVDGCEFNIWVSISHSQSHAIAQVILED
ncbi:holo-ACP synthase [Pontibacillus yanchengensis]|uniref:Holo-ACP synthase n=2 Tax=Pontibacillus yanchengensis TaxID=462910 RepID=A0ACC7VJS4_9BACI|nr:holo-ACP synthase [Pontibacillus yanchengensis]MYL36121.1 holo-ACP synthase [Pontibacillus yanchengensis]MYL55211.1 holo-ACP synthase [Pontibacillus yanchengensis]